MKEVNIHTSTKEEAGGLQYSPRKEMLDAQALEMAVGRGSQRKDEAESGNSLLIREGWFQYGSMVVTLSAVLAGTQHAKPSVQIFWNHLLQQAYYE